MGGPHQNLFQPGDHAPNDGVYMEVGEKDLHSHINNPQTISLKKGERFPQTTNEDRKWKNRKNMNLN
jgi:hypothetical protein